MNQYRVAGNFEAEVVANSEVDAKNKVAVMLSGVEVWYCVIEVEEVTDKPGGKNIVSQYKKLVCGNRKGA